MKKSQGTLIISNGQLIDGTGAAAVPDATLVIQDGVITYVGPAHGAPASPPDAGRIDARGGSIMPGLVEAHFHATYFNIAALEDLDIEVITCATKTGAEIMGRGDEFGTLEKGKLADVLVVDGDPLQDIAVLEDRATFLAVLQGGIVKAGRLAKPFPTVVTREK